MESFGFRFEVRRFGDHQLGLWRLQFRRARNPRRFVFLPGFGDTPLSWLGVVAMIAPTLRREYDEVILFDFPGFQGLLSEEPACESMDLLVASVQEVLRSLKPLTVAGHSLGGWLAAHFAVQAGRESRKWLREVILIAPSGVFGKASERREWEARFRRAIREGFQHLREALFAREPFWFRWVMGDFARFIQREDIVRFMLSIREDHAVENGLKDVRCRVWLLWGELDRLVPTSWYRHWLKALPARERERPSAVLLRGAGHSPQIEAPRATAQALARILGRRDLAERSRWSRIGRAEWFKSPWEVVEA